MTLAAVFKKTHAGAFWGVQPPFSTVTVTKNVSSAAGISVTANTGDSSVGAYVTASVLGTGVNADLLTNVPEAV